MAEEAERDDNFQPTAQGVSSADEEVTLNVYVNPDCDGAGTHGVVVKVVE
jgi:hypothetical protein